MPPTRTLLNTNAAPSTASSILDGAVMPHRPVVSLGPILVVLAFLTSLGLAVAIVVVREGTDPKVRYPEHVTRGSAIGSTVESRLDFAADH